MKTTSPTPTIPRPWRWPASFAAVMALSFAALADDDGGAPIPPVDPGPGYGGIPGGPSLPPDHVVDRSTIPAGVQTIYNTGDQTGDTDLHTRIEFSPTLGAIDWVSLVFQNSEQLEDLDYLPGTGGGGPGTVSLSLYEDMDPTLGTLGGLLGTTDAQSIEENTISWLTFRLPATISLTPGASYYLSLDVASGYSLDVAGVPANLNSGVRPHNFWYDPFWEPRGAPIALLDGNDEFLFAEGIITPIPEPLSVALATGLGLAAAAPLLRRMGHRRRPAP